MSEFPNKPRHISVVVDNPSWIMPYAQQLVALHSDKGDQTFLCRNHDEIKQGDVAFYLGCTKITPPEILAQNGKNLVVHASHLPSGRGFSPLTWMILEGENIIPVCLIEAVDEVDAGKIVFKENINFEGHELIDELHNRLGQVTIELCSRYLASKSIPEGISQQGQPTYYRRRKPEDSILDPERSLSEQFDLLRTVNNETYPAHFDYRGHRYVLQIKKA